MILLRYARRFFYKALRQPGYAFKVFFRRLEAYFYYLFSHGKSSYPEAITLFLTHRCNLHCKMCGQWGERGVTKKQSSEYIKAELSFNELQSFIDDATYFKPNITLFGGEPLLYPQCLELIRYIKQKSMHCLMITNGSLLENLAEELVKNRLDELNLSLDGNASLHDRIRGMPGLFAQIMFGLKKLDYFKQQLGEKKPLVNLQCTINQENYQYLEQLLEVAQEARVNSLTFHHLIFLNSQVLGEQKKHDKLLSCTSLDWEGFIFAPGIDPVLLHEKLQKILSKKYPFSVDVYPNLSFQELKWYYGNSNLPIPGYPARCLRPWITAYIFPDGEVRPCLNSSYSYGNIKKEKFRQLWNNAEAQRFRLELHKNKIFPVCSRCTELYRY